MVVLVGWLKRKLKTGAANNTSVCVTVFAKLFCAKTVLFLFSPNFFWLAKETSRIDWRFVCKYQAIHRRRSLSLSLSFKRLSFECKSNVASLQISTVLRQAEKVAPQQRDIT